MTLSQRYFLNSSTFLTLDIFEMIQNSTRNRSNMNIVQDFSLIYLIFAHSGCAKYENFRVNLFAHPRIHACHNNSLLKIFF